MRKKNKKFGNKGKNNFKGSSQFPLFIIIYHR